MLHDFLTANRDALIGRCREKVALRMAPKATSSELEHGIPFFLNQLIETLEAEQKVAPAKEGGSEISGESGGDKANGNGERKRNGKGNGRDHPSTSEMGVTASLHGRELLQHGFTVDQVVHDYGDLCQAITDLAVETSAPIKVDEFRTLNRCLDNGIAGAVMEFAFQHDAVLENKTLQAMNERLGVLAHELRNLIHTATLAATAIRSGNVGPGGATAAILDRSLIGLRSLVDRTLADVRVAAGMPTRTQRMALTDFIGEVKISGALEARSRECTFSVADIDSGLAIDGDRDMLLSAVGNLLQNAFKFTGKHTNVSLTAYAAGDRVRIEVEDHCGGLPPHAAEKMFVPFMQSGSDKSGLGLGLAISRRGVEANQGVISVRDLPGSGCVFTIDLPRHTLM
jgi:signal transduction histidine kinase